MEINQILRALVIAKRFVNSIIWYRYFLTLMILVCVNRSCKFFGTIQFTRPPPSIGRWRQIIFCWLWQHYVILIILSTPKWRFRIWMDISPSLPLISIIDAPWTYYRFCVRNHQISSCMIRWLIQSPPGMRDFHLRCSTRVFNILTFLQFINRPSGEHCYILLT